MISSQNSTKKRLIQLVNAAERLAAVQYEAGLKSGQPSEPRVKKKVDRCWCEFRVACDAVMNDYTHVPTILVKWRN